MIEDQAPWHPGKKDILTVLSKINGPENRQDAKSAKDYF